MRICSSSSVTTVPRRRFANRAYEAPPADGQSRALIAVESSQRNERSPLSARHPSAPFVAHVIAMRMRAPQTRERRRAEPEEAIAVYRSMTKPASPRSTFGTRA